jgi:hypothetical protein
MALRLINAPAISDSQNFRAREAFDTALEGMLQFVGSITIDLGSISAGATGSLTVSVPGVRADRGMTVLVGVSSTWNTGLIPYGFVSTDDVVTVVLFNSTGAPINPANDIYSVRVMP